MMKLALEPSILGGENEIPVASRAAVVSPMGNRGVVCQYGIQGHFSFVVISKIFRPCVDLFLSGRIPGHFAAKRVGLSLPSIRPFAHLSFQGISLSGHVLAP